MFRAYLLSRIRITSKLSSAPEFSWEEPLVKFSSVGPFDALYCLHPVIVIYQNILDGRWKRVAFQSYMDSTMKVESGYILDLCSAT